LLPGPGAILFVEEGISRVLLGGPKIARQHALNRLEIIIGIDRMKMASVEGDWDTHAME